MLTDTHTSVFPTLPDDVAAKVAALRSTARVDPAAGRKTTARKRPNHRQRWINATLGPDHVSPSEARVLAAICSGLNNAEAARSLFIGEETVKSHIRRMLARCGCANRTQLAYRWGRGELTERSRDGDIGRTP